MANVGKAGADLYQSGAAKTAQSKTQETKAAAAEYGRTIGEPKLSEQGQKYYEQLKKKFGQYDFILVSEDKKASAQANASRFANPYKTVVLIDEDKIEKMATDEGFRKQYEDILSGARSQLQQLKSSMDKTGANVKGYGMQINDGGTASFFAVLKKSSADQKARIEKNAAKKKAEKKAADKKAADKKADAKKAADKKAEKQAEAAGDEEDVVITANSVEELMKKLEEYQFAERSDMVQTESEKLVGQNIDFRG